jgi:hypothetical protein
METFGEYLFPEGDEPGRDPETFYTADFLADRGFQVVTCPSSSSWGDTVFTPRTWLHMANTFDSFKKGAEEHLAGSVLTSWSVRLHPWELQLPCVDIPSYLASHPDGTIQEFQPWFLRRRFGTDDPAFFRACGLLAKSCLFTDSGTLRVRKSCEPPAPDLVKETLARLAEKGQTEEAKENCRARLDEYLEAVALLEGFTRRANRGREYLDLWHLAACNLIGRAEASILLLEGEDAIRNGTPPPPEARREAEELLETLRGLKDETREFYAGAQRPTRTDETIAWMFAPVEQALAELASAGPEAGGG